VTSHYRYLTVHDSIVQKVKEHVKALISDSKKDRAINADKEWSPTNIYHLESELNLLVEATMVARAKNDSAVFNRLITRLSWMAATVDSVTQNHYWVPFMTKVQIDKLQIP